MARTWFDRFRTARQPRRRPLAETLEPRLLHSADLLVGLAPPTPPPEAGIVRTVDAAAPAPAAAGAQVAASRRVELVAVDPRAADAQRTVDALAAQRPDASLRVALLDASRDGWAQVSELIAGSAGAAAVHLVAGSGEAGPMLGSTALDAVGLAAHATRFAGWADTLAPGAALRLTGAAAAGEAGLALADALARATGVDAIAVPAVADPDAARPGWVFVDAGVDGWHAIVEDLRANRPDLNVVVLDPRASGLDAMLDALDGTRDLAEVHLFAHGADGLLALGADRVTADTLDASRERWQRLGTHLAAGADLMLYGCDLAADARGDALVAELAALTGADVAASTDPTGAAARGGDWVLERSTGAVDGTVAVSAALQAAWPGLLATFTVDSTDDTGTGSLRQAILDANASGDADDEIVFAFAGDEGRTIVLASPLPEITGPVRIVALPAGDGTPRIVVDGSAIDADADGVPDPGVDGLRLGAGSDGSEVRGLGFAGFSGAAIAAHDSGGHLIAGNRIGGIDLGAGPVGNGVGIVLSNVTNVTIGGLDPVDANAIAGNAGAGIVVVGAASAGNVFLGNSIAGNGQPGIDLGDDGPTANDAL
ncbi:MAG: hypothetical protein RJA99_3948, partial [Pseudomonadota bacterium]